MPWIYFEEDKILMIGIYAYSIKFITSDKFQLGQVVERKDWMGGILFTFTRIKEGQTTNGI